MSLPTAVTPITGMPTRSPASTSFVMLCTERVSCSPPMNTWMPMPAALSRTASSMSMAICSSDSSSRRMLGPPLARSTIGFCNSAGIIERRMPRVQNSASHSGSSGTIDRSMRSRPGGRALEVAVVDRQHHGAAGLRIEGPRQAVLHAPVELVGALEEKSRRGLRLSAW